ncbi:MAG TPA: glutamate-1-semialdehyde 2,1-aminomutase [Geobacterales bacterium]|nr:glutamate-1-semialdehyde 2,1-aminomutase [Geobacterales bacterium]
MKRFKSDLLYERASKVMVGGVNSPVRSFKYVGGRPIFIAKGKGSKIIDVDGNQYIDYVMSYGALIHGHANDKVLEKTIDIIEQGTTFGAPTEPELLLCEEITKAFPSIEKIRLVNSGTEATMSAIRLAKAYTKRKYILKFEGCYHGHVDQLLVRAGSGMATFGVPLSEGVDEEIASKTILCNYNDIEQLYKVFSTYGKEIAAIIVEPIAGNMGVVIPEKEFIFTMRELCDKYGSLLIFDEVITGFRVARGGAQELYNVEADLTCLGKIIGGGFPIGAYGGKREIMKMISPEGPVYQAGTLSGNPVACAAGLATISFLDQKSYEYLERISSFLEKEIYKIANEYSVDVKVNRVGSMFSIFFTNREVKDFQDVLSTNRDLFAVFHSMMLRSGIYLPPSPYEAMFLSTSHRVEDIQDTSLALQETFKSLK